MLQDNPIIGVVEDICSYLGRLEECGGGGRYTPPPRHILMTLYLVVRVRRGERADHILSSLKNIITHLVALEVKAGYVGLMPSPSSD